MYTIIYNLYFALKRKQKKDKENHKSTSLITQRILDRIEWFYNILICRWYGKFPSHKYGLNKKAREEKIIVSLTTFPRRIGTVWITIETLLRQSMKPDEIILWLASSQFHGLEDLPIELLRLQDRGLTIRFCDDLRSHKKYYYVMKENPDDLIILCDDDVFFPRDMIKKLMKLHNKNKYDIIGSTVAVVNDFDELPTYWGRPKCGERIERASNVQPFSGQGTLYPPHCLDEEYFFDKKLIMELCPNADDLWLFYVATKHDTKVSVVYKERSMPVGIYGTGESSLWQTNGKERQNDVQWMAILKHFGDIIDDEYN